MFCYKCGEKLPDDAKFCYKCGVNIDQYHGNAEDRTVNASSDKKIPDVPVPNAPDSSPVYMSFTPSAKAQYTSVTYAAVKKSKAPLIIGIAAAVIVVLIVGIILLVNNQSNSKGVKLSQTYTNNEEGISFKYPSAWKPISKSEYDDPETIVMLLNENEHNPDFNSVIRVMKFNRDREFIDHLFVSDSEFSETFSDYADITETSVIEIDGVSGRKVFYTDTEGFKWRSYFYAVNLNLYRVDFIKKTKNDGGLERFFDAIIDSYHITANKLSDTLFSTDAPTEPSRLSEIELRNILQAKYGELAAWCYDVDGNKEGFAVFIDEFQDFDGGYGGRAISKICVIDSYGNYSEIENNGNIFVSADILSIGTKRFFAITTGGAVPATFADIYSISDGKPYKLDISANSFFMGLDGNIYAEKTLFPYGGKEQTSYPLKYDAETRQLILKVDPTDLDRHKLDFVCSSSAVTYDNGENFEFSFRNLGSTEMFFAIYSDEYLSDCIYVSSRYKYEYGGGIGGNFSTDYGFRIYENTDAVLVVWSHNTDYDTYEYECVKLPLEVKTGYTSYNDMSLYNGTGNITNGGCAFYDNNMLYCSDHYGIYKFIDDSFTTIAYANALYLNKAGNRLFYVDKDVDCSIWSVDTDGNNQKELLSSYCYELTYYKERLYFSEVINGKHYISSILTDGGGYKRLFQVNCWYMNIYDNNIYFVNYDNGYSLDRIDLEGNSHTVLIDDETSDLCIYNGTLYFSSDREQRNMYCYDINNGDIEKIYDGYASNINVIDDQIFFLDDKNRLYSIQLYSNDFYSYPGLNEINFFNLADTYLVNVDDSGNAVVTRIRE